MAKTAEYHALAARVAVLEQQAKSYATWAAALDTEVTRLQLALRVLAPAIDTPESVAEKATAARRLAARATRTSLDDE